MKANTEGYVQTHVITKVMQRQTQTKDRARSQADTQTETAAQSPVDRHDDRNASDTGSEGEMSRYAGAQTHGTRTEPSSLDRLASTAVQSGQTQGSQ